MKHIKTKTEFAELWTKSPALICDFSATWCGPCKSLEPILIRLERDHPEIKFAKVDIDEHEALSDEHGVEAVPTVFFVKKGKVVKKIVGFERYESLSKQAKKLLD